MSTALTDLFQNDDSDNFEIWEKLIRAGEGLEGGINRNSSSQAITTIRSIYDRLLGKFPLFFGYWKKYADLEFSIAGTEAADMVNIASINYMMSVDWLDRFMSAEWPASPTLLTCGPTTVPSRPKPAMIRKSLESKCWDRIPALLSRPKHSKTPTHPHTENHMIWFCSNDDGYRTIGELIISHPSPPPCLSCFSPMISQLP
jgi:hypothetical protein